MRYGIDPRPEDWAYLAGLIDGDGSIFCSMRKQGTFRIIVTVSNNNIDLLQGLARKFGGASSRFTSDNYIAHTLGWEAQEAKKILRGILPYIDGKWEQACLALEFPTPGRGWHRRMDPRNRLIGERIYKRMRELNQVWSRGKVEGARK